jgi:cytochrome c oxidase subunit 4
MNESHSPTAPDHAAVAAHGEPGHDDHHDVAKHINKYLMVGGLLMVFTLITVGLSYVDFGSHKLNIGIGMLVATFKAGLVAMIFMHLNAERKLHLPRADFYRIFRVRLVLADVSSLVRSSGAVSMSLKGFHIVFITFSTLLAMVCGAWCLWVNSFADTSAYVVGAALSFASAVGLAVYGVWFYKKMKRLRIFT